MHAVIYYMHFVSYPYSFPSGTSGLKTTQMLHKNKAFSNSVPDNTIMLIHLLQLALYNKEIGDLLRPNPHEPMDPKVMEALK